MRSIIDVAMNVGPFAEALRRQGVETVIRYFNHRNSSRLPTKCLTQAELHALFDAGLSVAVVFQQGGGAGGDISDLTAETGARDAKRALELATGLEQPNGSAIYFAIDHDYVKSPELASIEQYFKTVRQVLNGKYLVGCYGSGTVAGKLKSLGLVEHIWLSGSTAWSGTTAMLASDRWSLFQKDLNVPFPNAGFFFDGNVQNPAFPNFGQFRRAGETSETTSRVATRTLMKVTARRGLVLRAGPAPTFDKLAVLEEGTLVEALGKSGDWVEVDLQGDGKTDGYMHSGFLRTISGGLPSAPTGQLRPLDVARAELARNIAEVTGDRNNPRIVLYHGTTSDGQASDEVAWCSSFVNFCVEQVGLRGTESKWAMSWHSSGWGTDVTNSPQEGDIAVFRRRQGSPSGTQLGGHVGFWLRASGDRITLLGGNQGNRVSITECPTMGLLGGHHYELLSIRRPPLS